MHVDVPSPGAHTGKLLICFVFAAAFGGFEPWRGLSAGRMKEVDASVLESGSPPPGTWLQVNGRALWDKAALQRRRNQAVYLVPLVSEGWQPSQPVAVFLEIRRDMLSPAPKGASGVDAYDGTIIRWRGLGTRAKEQLAAKGICPAGHYLMIQGSGTPESMFYRGLISLALALAALILIPVIRWIESLNSGSSRGTEAA